MRIRLLLLACAAALVVAACSDSEAGMEELRTELNAFEVRLLEHEEAIAVCMREYGFEYVAVLPSDWIMERETQLDVARGGDGRVDPEQLDIPANPNDAIVAGMSEEEVAAYEFAYWGDADLGGDIPGCYQTTYQDVWGLDLLADLSTETAELEQLLASDERLTAAEDDYLECMRSDGFAVANFNDVHRLIDERFQQLKADAAQLGIDIEDAPGYEAYDTFNRTAMARHDECAVPYYEVYDVVHAERVAEVFEG